LTPHDAKITKSTKYFHKQEITVAGNLTRINNNQITDASSGNTQLGIDASTKLQNYSITSGKLANDITYGSNLTITGNLAVQGNTTTIDTTTVTIEDPILLLASNQTGTPTVDIGYIGQRGTFENIGFIWDEGNTAFATIFTDSTAGADVANTLSYANLITGNANVTGVLTAANISFTGNVAGNLNVTGNLTANNIQSVNGLSSNTANVTGTANIGNVETTTVTATGNVTGGNVSTAGNVSASGFVSATGNVDGGNVNTAGNVSGANVLVSTLSNTQVVFSGLNGQLLGSSNITYTPTGLSVVGNVDSTNVAATANVQGANVIATTLSSAGQIVLAGSGGLLVGNAGLTYANGNLDVTGNASITGNITAGNINANVTSNVTPGQIVFAGAGGALIGNVNLTFDEANNITTLGNLSTTGNVVTNGFTSVTGNVTGGNVNGKTTVSAGTPLSADGLISVYNGVTLNEISLNGQTGAVSTFGNVTGANFLTGGLVSATGNVDGGNVNTGGVVSAVGNVTGGNVSTLGNVVGSNNVQGGNVLTNNLLASGNLSISAVGGISLDPNGVGNGNINVNTAHINNLQTPVQPLDAANKEYVDAIAQGLDLKSSVDVATTGPLDAEAEVTTVAYFNGPTNNGVGATLTITTTSQLLFDGVDLSTLGTGETARVLVKNELDPAAGNSDAAWNGIYFIVSSSALSTVLQRSVDFDNEGALGNIPGAFVFDIGGGTQNGTGWVCITANPVVMGTTPIIFTQFSGAGTYIGGNAIAINGQVITTLYDGNTVGVNGSNQLYIPANAPLVTPNIGNATGSSLNLVDGNINLGNLIANSAVNGNTFSATGNVTGGNILTGGDVLASAGNVYGNNVNAVSSINSQGTISATTSISTNGFVSAVGNVTGGNVSTVGNVTGGNLLAVDTVYSANLSLSGNVISALNVTGNMAANSIFATTDMSAGNVISATGNILSGANISATGNITAANFTTTGGSGNITGANIITAVTLSATGNIFSDGNVSAVGNVLGAFLWGDGSNITGLSTSASNISNGTSNVEIYTANGNVSFGVNGTNNVMIVSDTVTSVSADFSAVGNVVSNEVYGNHLYDSSLGNYQIVFAYGNGVGQLQTNPALAITGSGTGFYVGYPMSVSGNVTANTTMLVDTTTNTVSLGANITQTTGATLAINATDSMLLPVGNTLQRPATPATGMFRWNNQETYLEVWDGTQWQDVGATQYTVIANEQFFGDGTTVNFTLGQTLTTDACLVSINGVVQAPTTAYAVTGTTLTFTEAPEIGDIIEVRELTTTTSVGSINNGNLSLSAVSSPANVVLTGGNLVVASGGYLYGDGTYLTNVGGGNVIATKIVDGTSSVDIDGAGGSIITNVAGSNVLVTSTTATTITGNFNPSANVTYSLGNATNRWSTLYVAGNTIYLGDGTLTSNASGITMTNSDGGSFTVSGNVAGAGNIAGGNVAVSGAVSAVGNITGSLFKGNASFLTSITGANVTGTVGSATIAETVSANAQPNITSVGTLTFVATSGTISGDGNGISNIQGANVFGTVSTATTAGTVTTNAQSNITSVGTLTSLSVSGTVTVGSGITNGQGNGVGNIGSSSNYFNTIFATATSAQYADLAEKYTADAEYAPGTVVSFGGSAEVTASTADGDRRVAGVVSTNPSYIMNGGLEGANVVTVALTGRVPCRVTGTVRKGDLMVSNGDGTARAEADPKAGAIIGKALADFDGAEGTIEVVVGRF
jgi:hypothetical protein